MSKKKVIKQATTQLVYHKLVGALAELRIGTNDKKFTKKLKAASRMLGEDISEVLIKTIPQKVKIKKPKNKAAKKGKKETKMAALESVKIKKFKKEKPGSVTEETTPVNNN
jgi:hypothetical protein